MRDHLGEGPVHLRGRTLRQAMRRRAVRRLPVVDREGHVIGVLSIDDIVRWGVVPTGVRAAFVIDALNQICDRRASTQSMDTSLS